MSGLRYILHGHDAVEEPDLIAWAKWMEGGDAVRRVKEDFRDGVRISTVFLGVDHQFGRGPPLLFETMIFAGEHDQEQWRYSTWDEAEAGHANACRVAFGSAP